MLVWNLLHVAKAFWNSYWFKWRCLTLCFSSTTVCVYIDMWLFNTICVFISHLPSQQKRFYSTTQQSFQSDSSHHCSGEVTWNLLQRFLSTEEEWTQKWWIMIRRMRFGAGIMGGLVSTGSHRQCPAKFYVTSYSLNLIWDEFALHVSMSTLSQAQMPYPYLCQEWFWQLFRNDPPPTIPANQNSESGGWDGDTSASPGAAFCTQSAALPGDVPRGTRGEVLETQGGGWRAGSVAR